jgi:hypothetical protein
MGTRLTPDEITQLLRKRAAQSPARSPAEVAETENALDAAEDIARRGRTDRRCLVCSGELIVEHIGASYLVRCQKENRAIVTSRGI